jgi:hypothetical protein
MGFFTKDIKNLTTAVRRAATMYTALTAASA